MVKRGLIGLILLIICLMSAWTIEVGKDAPKFANPDFNNKYFVSKDVIGKNWVIVSFFATYCEGCKKELPELEKLYEELTNEQVKVDIIIVATDPEGTPVVKPYFDKNPTTLTVILDRFKATTKKYGVVDLPTLFLINPAGKIAFTIDKYSPETVEKVKALILKKNPAPKKESPESKTKEITKAGDEQ